MVPPSLPQLEPLCGDASSRRYHRARFPTSRTLIRVEYPAHDQGRLARDLETAAWLGLRGLRVPAVLARDSTGIAALLEDFGPADAADALSVMVGVDRLAAVERLLIPLQRLAAVPVEDLPPWNPPLDFDRLRWELAGWELWWVVDRKGRRPTGALTEWLDALARQVADHPRRVCHRDYHLNNLFLLPDGEVGVIDAQDVLVGPDTYDLASLLGERALPGLLPAADRHRAATRWAELTAAAPGWERRLELTGLQRGLKVIGTFARLEACGRTGYERWLADLLPRVASRAAAAGAPALVTDLLLDC